MIGLLPTSSNGCGTVVEQNKAECPRNYLRRLNCRTLSDVRGYRSRRRESSASTSTYSCADTSSECINKKPAHNAGLMVNLSMSIPQLFQLDAAILLPVGLTRAICHWILFSSLSSRYGSWVRHWLPCSREPRWLTLAQADCTHGYPAHQCALRDERRRCCLTARMCINLSSRLINWRRAIKGKVEHSANIGSGRLELALCLGLSLLSRLALRRLLCSLLRRCCSRGRIGFLVSLSAAASTSATNTEPTHFAQSVTFFIVILPQSQDLYFPNVAHLFFFARRA